MTEISDIRILRLPRRTLTLQIEADGAVLVKAPMRLPDGAIREFISAHREWIEKHKQLAVQHHTGNNHEYRPGEKFLFLGNPYTLVPDSSKVIILSGTSLLYPSHLQFRIRKELLTWYQKKAREIISGQVHDHAGQMGVSYSGIYFSDTRSKWGSCSADNTLQFNWRLVMAPLLVVRYVIIHELAHTIEKNHSRAFWDTVARYNPSFRQQRKWLKTEGHTLTL